jgi:glutathione S-transferase
MSRPYRIFGAEVSPYSIKVRSYFRYKGIEHEWIVRDASRMQEFQQLAKLPIIPLVVTPDAEVLQDSTPIIEELEARHPTPSIQPDSPALAFLSALLEEFGDEWGNKWMFHFRWAREADQRSAGTRIGQLMLPGGEGEELASVVSAVIERMTGRVWFVGSNETTAPQIEASARAAIQLLEAHLTDRAYLFGGRPSLGDLGLWGQVYNMWTDPTPRSFVETAPSVVAWVQRMLEPQSEGDWESLAALRPTLLPLLERQLGRLFLPWSDANARAIAAGQEEFSIELDGRTWTQKPQKYHAKSLAEIRRKYAAIDADAELDQVLDVSGCRSWLAPRGNLA